MAYPSKDFLEEVKRYDILFEDFHKTARDGILRIFGVVEKFAAVLEKNFPNSDKDVIRKFAKSRTIARVNAIARKLANDRLESLRAKRKKIEFAHSCKPSSKEVEKKKAEVEKNKALAKKILNKAKKALTKKSSVKKSPAEKTLAKKAPVKNAPIKKAPVKKTPVKKAPVKKAPIQKAPIRKAPTIRKAPIKKTKNKNPIKKAPDKTVPDKKSALNEVND